MATPSETENVTTLSKLLNLSVNITHICLMDFSILINWTSPFWIIGVSDVLFHFYSISNRNSCKQTVKTLIRRRDLRRLIWVCTVCLCPKDRTLGLYGLSERTHILTDGSCIMIYYSKVQSRNTISCHNSHPPIHLYMRTREDNSFHKASRHILPLLCIQGMVLENKTRNNS